MTTPPLDGQRQDRVRVSLQTKRVGFTDTVNTDTERVTRLMCYGHVCHPNNCVNTFRMLGFSKKIAYRIKKHSGIRAGCLALRASGSARLGSGGSRTGLKKSDSHQIFIFGSRLIITDLGGGLFGLRLSDGLSRWCRNRSSLLCGRASSGSSLQKTLVKY